MCAVLHQHSHGHGGGHGHSHGHGGSHGRGGGHGHSQGQGRRRDHGSNAQSQEMVMLFVRLQVHTAILVRNCVDSNHDKSWLAISDH